MMSFLLMTALWLTASGQSMNRLYLPDISVESGKAARIPVAVDNSDEIVALQFDLTLPAGITALGTVTFSERGDGHTAALRKVAENRYRLVAFSSANKPFRGNAGNLLFIDVNIPAEMVNGSVHAMTVSDVVLSKATGENVVTASEGGNLTVLMAPDLVPSEVSIDKTSIAPEEHMVISWKVSNSGGVATKGSWKEQIYLVSADGSYSKLVATEYNETTLASSGVTARSCEVALPQQIGFDGKGKVLVKVTPDADCGEPESSRGNNSTLSTVEINISRRLYLTLPSAPLSETDRPTVKCQITRSGDCSETETYTITSTPTDTRLAIPSTVEIPRGSHTASFYIQVTPNGKLDNDTPLEISVSGNDYPEIKGGISIEDDTLPDMTLKGETDEINEGDIFSVTVTLARASSSDVEVKVSSDYGQRFRIPASTVIPAGQTKAEIEIEAIDDDIPDNEKFVTFTATAAGYNPGHFDAVLYDNDLPTLSLELVPAALSEAAGPTAVTAKIRRLDNADKRITIRLSDDSDGQIYYSNSSFVMEPGVEESTVALGPVDNSIVDGERTYIISAAVYIASCACSVGEGSKLGLVTMPLTLYDNDGPTLSLTLASSVVKEGESIKATVSRNAEMDKAVSVAVSSDNTDFLNFPSTVTIPAGKASVEFTVTAKSNTTSGDGSNVSLTVEAADFAKASSWFTISDQTLPDAQITSLNISASEVAVCDSVTVSLTLANTGSFDLPELTKISVYTTAGNEAIASIFLQNALPQGDSVEFSRKVAMPESVGEYTVYAVANPDRSEKELSYTNNTSAMAKVKVVSPYSGVVKTDRQTYLAGETVKISGQLAGSYKEGQEVEIYIVNSGYRHEIKAVAGATGSFEANYTPFAAQMGHFALGMCYPGEGSTAEDASFEVIGLKTASNEPVVCETSLDEPFVKTFEIVNPSTVALSGLKCEVVNKPDCCDVVVEIPSTIAGEESAEIKMTITPHAVSTGTEWERIDICLKSAEGVELPMAIRHYCYNATGELVASVTRINTTMIKGQSRDYQFEIANVGKGETGKITLALPSWMKSATPLQMSSLANGEKATVVLRLTPTDDMQLNVPVSGQIGINCENGKGMALPYYIEPVSEVTGTLTIDACDESTYYTAQAPHLAGAKVTVSHPTTNKVVASGVTGEDGHFSVELPEGYYAVSVTADRHSSYRNNFMVDPGRETVKVVNLSFEAITVEWNVEETEVEDEYKIVTTVEFETSVPVPVVELTIPQRIAADELRVGESLIFYATLVNKGLIRADDVELQLPTGMRHLTFEPLDHADPFSLAPKQAVTIPVKVTRTSMPQSGQMRLPDIDNDPCADQVGTLYFWDCGLDRKWHRYGVALQLGSCDSNDPSTWDNSGNGNGYIGGWWGWWGWGGPGGGLWGTPYGPSTTNDKVSESEDKGCEPCQNRFLYKMTKCVTGFIPVFKWVWTIVDWVSDPLDQAKNEGRDKLVDWGEGRVGNKLKPVYGWMKKFIKFVDVWGNCVKPLYEPCDPGNFTGAPQKQKAPSGYPSYIDEYVDIMKHVENINNFEGVLFEEMFGDLMWLNADEDEFSEFVDLATEMESSGNIDYERLYANMPSNVSKSMVNKLIERWQNSRKFTEGDNIIDFDAIISAAELRDESLSVLSEMGYENIETLLQKETDKVMEKLTEASNSVCSSVTLQFTQTMTMTRQAFRGTLRVVNGNETESMKDVKLNLVVTDESGRAATSREFQINAETLTGFQGELSLDGGWTLAANQEGVLTVLFIPTKYAAPEVETRYGFGGSLSYIDPFTGLEVTRTLTPVTLTVKPSPELDLTYFMQRDIYGDDALTEDVEPMVPGEFAMIINNKGNGDATNVKLYTAQPEIIRNDKGLLIDFELLSTQLNGGDATLMLGGGALSDFGTIPAKSQAYAQWWLQSTLLGHFVKYDIEATHVTSYDNPDLSLLDNVEIHELIHGFNIGVGEEKPLRAFLVNDITDAEDMPDNIYFTDATQAEVAVTGMASVERRDNLTYVLTVTPVKEGWNYGSILDPTNGRQAIKEIKRMSDGKILSIDNFWQTDRILRDGRDPLKENRLHFVDNFADASVSYQLTFEPRPDVILEVDSITGIDLENQVQPVPVKELSVYFNKPVEATTFTTDDLTLLWQGEKQDVKDVKITAVDNRSFRLGIESLTALNGHYVLTVQAASIVDNEGYTGEKGKTLSWTQYANGTVNIVTKAEPAEGGKVTPESGTFPFGSQMTLKATPSEGYSFNGWLYKNDVVSDAQELVIDLNHEGEYIARFTPKNYGVTVDFDAEGGVVDGAATGIYAYGDTLVMTAVPAGDWRFDGWIVDGVFGNYDSTLSVIVKGDTRVEAVFVDRRLRTSFDFESGWTWMSHQFDSDVDAATLMRRGGINRIVGQLSEMISDPVAGLVGNLSSLAPATLYKVEAAESTTTPVVYGLVANPGTPISLVKGWNWIGFTETEPMSLDDMESSEKDDYIVGQEGFAQHDGQTWVGTLTALTPGAGYLYRSESAKYIVYPHLMPTGASAVRANMPVSHLVDVRRYPQIMGMIAVLVNDLDEVVAPNTCEVRAYCGDVCRGVGQVVQGRLMISVYGNAGDRVRIAGGDGGSSDQFVTLAEVVLSETLHGSLDEPVRLKIGDLTSTGLVDGLGERSAEVRNRVLYINGVAADGVDLIELYDNVGRRVMTRNDLPTSGISVAGLPAGVYVVTVDADGCLTRHKVIIK